MPGTVQVRARTSPLEGMHVEMGAKLGPFGGWLMPIEYSGNGVLAEHEAVRNRVGIFDVSHMGTLVVHGSDPAGSLGQILTSDVAAAVTGSAKYGFLCDDAGGVIDDVIAYRGRDDVVLVSNAANTAAVFGELRELLTLRTSVRDVSDETAIIAVQGPRSPKVIAAVGLPERLAYMTFVEARGPDGDPVTVARTGYTGEVGYEILMPAATAAGWWKRLHEAALAEGGLACGFAARDVLRTEMGYPLYGNELSREISPVAAGLGWAIAWGKPEFRGRAALAKEKADGPARVSRALRCVSPGIPRAGMNVKAGSGVGVVTSGTFSPILRVGIALALMPPSTEVGDHVEIDIRARPCAAEVVKAPMVPADPRRDPEEWKSVPPRTVSSRR